MFGPGHPDGEVGEDEIIPAVVRDEPVGAGEIDAALPFLCRNLRAHVRRGFQLGCHVFSPSAGPFPARHASEQ